MSGAQAVTVVRLPWDGRQQTVSRVLTVVAREDLELGERLHAPSSTAAQIHRPYSVVCYPGALHVCSFDDALTRALLRGEPASVLVTRVRADELAAGGSAGPTIRLAFTSPTTFRVAGFDHPFPDPFHVFGGLLGRWQALGWPELSEPTWKRVPCWPETLTFGTHPKAGNPRRGVLGAARYEVTPQDEAGRAALWALARFAEYAGVGQGTTYGLGRVRLLGEGERWMPRDPRVSAWDRSPAPAARNSTNRL